MEEIKNFLYPLSPPTRVRTRPLEVLCVGPSRSGTWSLRAALLHLGYDHTYHGFDVVTNPPDDKAWYLLHRQRLKYAASQPRSKGLAISSTDFDQVVGHCAALTDHAAAVFAPELIAAYPKAKVILNVRRDVRAWHNSVMNTIVVHSRDWGFWFKSFFHTELFWAQEGYYRGTLKWFYRGDFQHNSIDVLIKHCERVRSLVPKDQLLEWDVEDGWEPLCKFLGKEVPDIPFPKTNDSTSFFKKCEECYEARVLKATPNVTDWLLWLIPKPFVQLAPQTWLINISHRLKNERKINDSKRGDPVVRISYNMVVKYGTGVSPGEAATQEYASQHVDPNIVRVPRVYRYFQHHDPSDTKPKGYLFMEYIPGQNLKTLNNIDSNSEITKKLTKIIAHLGQIKGGGVPGPVGGGIPRGYLWGDNGAKMEFGSLEDMNAWVNKRIELLEEAVDLTPHSLSLCHMDLCRRNIILMEDRSICLLDWGHAGFFPRFYEIAAIKCSNDHYSMSLFEATTKTIALTEEELRCMDLVIKARDASLRWSL
ncbi:hypothetical protein MaudMau93_005289 [Microsporum audouinii]